MVPQPNIAAKPLPVSTIDLEKAGRANVTFRTPVTDTEHFYFTVPKTAMQTVMESIEAHDTRGGAPRVTFPGPMVTRGNSMFLKKTSTWYDVLKRHQGAHIELQTRGGPVEGNFIGLQRQSHQVDPWIVLKTGDNIGMHDPETISTISFKSVEVAKRLDRYTSTLCRVQEEDSFYRINIIAAGLGDGELCVSYTAWSYFCPAFDFCYSMYCEDGKDANIKNGADQGPTIRSTVRVKCYAVIRNPLHYDLKDVHFILHTGRHRFPQRDIYSRVAEQVDKQPAPSSSTPSRRRRRGRRYASMSDSPSRTPPRRSRSPSPKRESPVLPPPPRSPAKSASSHAESETSSSTTSDSETVLSVAATSVYAQCLDSSREMDVPDRVCIKEGESAKVLLYETHIEGGAGHHCSYRGAQDWTVILHNTTDKVIEPGLAMFVWKNLVREMNMPCIKPGEDQCFHMGNSGCDVKKIRSDRRGEVLWSRIVGKSLVSKVIWYHEQKYITFNKEDEQIDVLLDYPSGERTGREMQLSARFYPKVSITGDPEDEDSGVELERYSKKGFHSVATFMVRVAPKQRCAVVVNEKEMRLYTVPILAYHTREEVAQLEELKMIGPTLAEKLKRLMNMRRKMNRLYRTRKLHRTRLDNIKEYEKGLVKLSTPNEAKDEDDKNKRYFAAVNEAEDSMEAIEDSIDEIETRIAKLKQRIRIAREEICDMDYVDLCDGEDGNVADTVI